MKRFYLMPLILSVFLVSACADDAKKKESEETKTEDLSKDNPLMKKSDLPYQAPDFTKIKNEHFKPAIEAGIEAKHQEIKAIAENEEEPTFDNTLVALERSGQDLNRVMRVFYLLTSSNTNDELQALQEEIAPKLAALSDAIYLNDDLFQKVKSIHAKLDDLDLDAESKRLVDYYYDQFVLSGANLPGDRKEQMKILNGELAKLQSQFNNKLIEATKRAAFVVDSEDQLKGMSESAIRSAGKKAAEKDLEGKYEIALQNTTQQPALTDLEVRETREKLFRNSYTRAQRNDQNDTQETLKRIAEIRAQQASLMGYENYAEWNLQDQMAKTPEAVQDLLGQIIPAATHKAKEEAAEIQQLMKEMGVEHDLKAWDWNFYAEKLRKQKYDLDENEIKPYFEMNQVLEDGVFYAATQLFGITFKERKDIPVYQEDVRVFELFEEDGTSIGLFYADFYKRDNKGGGAWMSNIVGQSKLLDTKPVIYNVCNFSKPAEGEPALLTFDNVITMFHEFGHALHGFFADQQYPSLSGTSVARDFVEFPSQFNEHWALYPSILSNYAKHYKTGEVIPEELVAKIKNAGTFNNGYSTTELMAATQLDLQWHTLAPDAKVGTVDEFEQNALEKTGVYMEQVPTRYRSSYFKHIFGGGYAAGYYAYTWTKVLDDDAYAWFEENGGLTRENGQRYREMILSRGNTMDYNQMFKDFRGSEPNIEPFLKAKGLK